MLPQSVNIGPLTFHLYGLIISISVLLGWFLAKKRAQFYNIPPKLWDDPIILIPLILAIILARLYHVLDYWQVYKLDPKSIVLIANGGLGIWGAVVGLIIGFYLVARFKNLALSRILDSISPSLMLGHSLGRIGNYINQEGFGPPTEMPWAVFIDEAHRPLQFSSNMHFHPTFFYEALIDAIFFLFLLHFSPKLKKQGQVFSLYLIFYSIGRFAVEFYRIDTWTIGIVKIAQLLSVLTFLVGLSYFLHAKKKIRVLT